MYESPLSFVNDLKHLGNVLLSDNVPLDPGFDDYVITEIKYVT